MTATVTTRYGRPIDPRIPHAGNGDLMISTSLSGNPGTLWERVAESAPSNLDRYALMMGFGHNSGLSVYDNMRNMFAKRWALERAKATHPAGKGIKRQEAQ